MGKGPGERVTHKDVAERAKVSTTLVSYIINDRQVSIPQETRDRVLRAIEELHYVPSATARGLRSSSTRLIAQVVLHYEPDLMMGSQYFAGKTAALIDSLVPHGYYHLTYPVPDGEEPMRRLLDFLRSRRVDGIVVEGADTNDPLIGPIAATKVPFVLFDQPAAPCEGSAVVNMDDERGMRLATEHLIGLGHERIGYLQGCARSWCDAKRQETFEAVLRERGLGVREEWIRGDGSCSMEDGRRSTDEILDLRERPTAIAATCDLLALGALKAIKERGLRVPEDLALIGFDDIQAAALLTPSLSTIALSYRRLGELAAEQVLKLIADPSLRLDPVTVGVRLVPRASTIGNTVKTTGVYP
jgi:LacI family transcriptional regulator